MVNNQDDSGQALMARVRQDMRYALKHRDLVTANTLKSLLAAFSHAEAVAPVAASHVGAGVGSTEAPRKLLTHQDVNAIIQAEITEIEQLTAQPGLPAHYTAALAAKANTLRAYL